jgi:hypothetical protein
MPSFARELDNLIRLHLGTPRYCEDFMPILDALCSAAEKLAAQADGCRCRDESEAEFHEREGLAPALTRQWVGLRTVVSKIRH